MDTAPWTWMMLAPQIPFSYPGITSDLWGGGKDVKVAKDLPDAVVFQKLCG